MCRFYRTFVVIGILVAFSLSTVIPAFASADGRKNTAIALSAATLYYAFAKKDKTPAVLLAGGSVYAWKNYNNAHKREKQAKRARSSYRTYRPSGYGGYSARPARSYRRYSSARYAPARRYSRPVSYVRPANSGQVEKLRAQVRDLRMQNIKLKHQAEMRQIQAQNEQLKAAASKYRAGLIGLLSVLAMGAMAFGLSSKRFWK